MRNLLDDEKFQLTAIAVASVSIVALLTFFASRPAQGPEPLTANLQVPKSSRAPETSDLRKAIPDQARAPVAEKQVTPETKQEPERQAPATQGGSSPAMIPDLSLWPPVIPEREAASDKGANFPEPMSERPHWRTKAALIVSKNRPATQRAPIKRELRYGPLPNRKSEYRSPDSEPDAEPIFDLPFGF
jgi:hypothetical protein